MKLKIFCNVFYKHDYEGNKDFTDQFWKICRKYSQILCVRLTTLEKKQEKNHYHVTTLHLRNYTNYYLFVFSCWSSRFQLIFVWFSSSLWITETHQDCRKGLLSTKHTENYHHLAEIDRTEEICHPKLQLRNRWSTFWLLKVRFWCNVKLIGPWCSCNPIWKNPIFYLKCGVALTHYHCIFFKGKITLIKPSIWPNFLITYHLKSFF